MNDNLEHLRSILGEISEGLGGIIHLINIRHDFLDIRFTGFHQIDEFQEILFQRIAGTEDIQFLFLQ